MCWHIKHKQMMGNIQGRKIKITENISLHIHKLIKGTHTVFHKLVFQYKVSFPSYFLGDTHLGCSMCNGMQISLHLK